MIYTTLDKFYYMDKQNYFLRKQFSLYLGKNLYKKAIKTT